jgi:ATP-binding cassette subfamily B protein
MPAIDRDSANAEITYEPTAVQRRFDPPLRSIDPDRSHHWVRRLAPLIAARRWRFIVAMIAGIAGIVVQVAVPVIVRGAIDNGLESNINPYVFALVVLAFVRFGLSYVFRLRLFEVALGVEADLRTLIYEHLTRLSFEYYDRTQSGQIISRANSDIRSIQVLLSFGPLVLTSGLMFVLALVVMLTINVPLTIVAVALLPGVYVLGQRMREIVFPLSWVSQSRQAEISTIVDENVNGVRVVRSFTAEQREVTKLAASADRLRWSQMETIAARARYNPAIEALPRLGMAMVLLYGGWLAIDGQVSIGTLVAFNSYVIMMQVPFRMIGFLVLQYERAAASAQRIYEVLDEPVSVVDADDAVDLPEPPTRIEFSGVHFSYGSGEEVLRGVDLDIAPSETVAIVGRTGSGKSTIARLIGRYYDVDAGSVCLDGHDVRSLTLLSVRHHVGMIPDEAFLFSTSIHDNIAFGRPNASRAEVEVAARAARADGFIRDLGDGYDTVIGERGFTLSGGQRQRISIARTILEQPSILVLDDATSAIDVQVETAIHDALSEQLSATTTVLVAHRLSTIALADRVVLVEDGVIAASGTHEELLANDSRYAAVLADGAADDDRTDVDADSVAT